VSDLGLRTTRDSSDFPEVIEAAKQASAHEFITAKPLQYATFTGATGLSQLSGGQKQRVAIARALVRDPRIFIGDEATSALDSKSEREVQAALDALFARSRAAGVERTTVLVAHRLSTIAEADQIFVLERGHLAEKGRHRELLSREGGLYRRLAMAQDDAALHLDEAQHRRHGADGAAAGGAAAAADGGEAPAL